MHIFKFLSRFFWFFWLCLLSKHLMFLATDCRQQTLDNHIKINHKDSSRVIVAATFSCLLIFRKFLAQPVLDDVSGMRSSTVLLKVVFYVVRCLYMSPPEKVLEHLQVIVLFNCFFEKVWSEDTLGWHGAPHQNFLIV